MKSKVKPTKAQQIAIDALISQTNWTEFWNKVTEKSAAEIEAYRIARAKSLKISHVFL